MSINRSMDKQTDSYPGDEILYINENKWTIATWTTRRNLINIIEWKKEVLKNAFTMIFFIKSSKESKLNKILFQDTQICDAGMKKSRATIVTQIKVIVSYGRLRSPCDHEGTQTASKVQTILYFLTWVEAALVYV